MSSARDGRQPAAAARGRPRTAAPRPPRVLVLDDDAALRQLIAVYLKVAGFEVGMASDVPAALAEARRAKPDVLVVDARMLRAGGAPAVAWLRADPGLLSVRVVVLTPAGGSGDLAAAGGVDATIAKPFDPAELISVLRHLATLPSRPGR
jgi:CheY-like chemotaxis protein